MDFTDLSWWCQWGKSTPRVWAWPMWSDSPVWPYTNGCCILSSFARPRLQDAVLGRKAAASLPIASRDWLKKKQGFPFCFLNPFLYYFSCLSTKEREKKLTTDGSWVHLWRCLIRKYGLVLNYAANEEQTGGLSPFWVVFSVPAEDEDAAGECGLMLSPSQMQWMVTSLREEWRGCDRRSPFGCCCCSPPANRAMQLPADPVCVTAGWGSSTSHRSLLEVSPVFCTDAAWHCLWAGIGGHGKWGCSAGGWELQRACPGVSSPVHCHCLSLVLGCFLESWKVFPVQPVMGKLLSVLRNVLLWKSENIRDHIVLLQPCRLKCAVTFQGLLVVSGSDKAVVSAEGKQMSQLACPSNPAILLATTFTRVTLSSLQLNWIIIRGTNVTFSCNGFKIHPKMLCGQREALRLQACSEVGLQEP